MRNPGICSVVVAAGVALWAAGPVAALVCTPCQTTPPVGQQGVRTSDYAPINVIGGVKDVFGALEDLPKWDRVRRVLDADTMAADPRMQPWVAWAEALRGYPVSQRLNAINLRVNQRVRYASERVDNWQTPLETVARGAGDCEDFAILKYYLALHAGVTHDDLSLVIGRIISTGELHAVMVARSERAWRLLDNRINNVVDLGGHADLSTIFFVDVNEVWVPVARPARR